MRRSRSILSAVIVLLVGAGALAAAAQSTAGKAGKEGYGTPPAKGAVTIKAGDDGWVTEPTTWDLAQYPIAKVFGVKYAGHTKVVLKGKPLSSDLGDIDRQGRRSAGDRRLQPGVGKAGQDR